MHGPAAALSVLLDDLGLDLPSGDASFSGDPAGERLLRARYPLAVSAAALTAAVGLAAVRVGERRGLRRRSVAVDVTLAAAHLRGFLDQERDGEVLDHDPTGKLPAVALVRAGDGRWVQLYGAFPPLRERTLEVLGCEDDRDAVRAAAARWDGEALVERLVDAGAPAALVLDAATWAEHPVGDRLAAEPPVVLTPLGAPGPPPMAALASGSLPLEGLRVLDLSRIVAGPVAGRTLAELGADVLHVEDADLHQVQRAFADTSRGKRSAHLSLHDGGERERLRALAAQADVVVQNARPGRMAAHGLGPEDLARARPGIVVVTIDAFGPDGPWAARAGFEPLVQAATGWAVDHAVDGVPRIVPALPCDHVTATMAALGALVALEQTARDGRGRLVRATLARTAMWLRAQPGRVDPTAAPAALLESTRDRRLPVDTHLGELVQLPPALRLAGRELRVADRAPRPGEDAPAFAPRP